MANTTDFIITCADEDEIISDLSEQTDILFNKISNPDLCGGPKAVWFEAYAACYRCVGIHKINEVISAFNRAPFVFPELAALTIDDDDGEYRGVVTRQ